MSEKVKTISVFCGSSTQLDQSFTNAARDMGEKLAQAGYTLVYGAGCTGMMGALARGAIAQGGTVVGITHRREAAHTEQLEGLCRLEILETLPDRKARMVELADAFVILPGGYGTMDELFEILAWTQIGLQHKPIALLNVREYFNDLLRWVDRAAGDCFIRPEDRRCFCVYEDPETLLNWFGTC